MLLVVWVEDFDRDAASSYAEALRETGVVAEYGGVYVSAGRPKLLLEGDWPDDRAFVAERYPCEAAALEMWNSETYQTQVKPFREGTGSYTVFLIPTERQSSL